MHIIGIVGGGIAKAFLDAGARVVAPARSDSSKSKVLDFLGGSSDRVYVPVLDVNTLSGAEALAKYITDSVGAELDFVVSISGGMAPPGLMTDATPETLAVTVHDKIEGHLWLAKALVPLMKKDAGSSYLVVTGMLGEIVPWPETALTAVGNAAVYGFTVALQAELKESPVKVNEFRIAALIRRDAEKDNPMFAGAPAVAVSKVAKLALGAMTGAQRDGIVRVGDAELQ